MILCTVRFLGVLYAKICINATARSTQLALAMLDQTMTCLRAPKKSKSYTLGNLPFKLFWTIPKFSQWWNEPWKCSTMLARRASIHPWLSQREKAELIFLPSGILAKCALWLAASQSDFYDLDLWAGFRTAQQGFQTARDSARQQNLKTMRKHHCIRGEFHIHNSWHL